MRLIGCIPNPPPPPPRGKTLDVRLQRLHELDTPLEAGRLLVFYVRTRLPSLYHVWWFDRRRIARALLMQPIAQRVRTPYSHR